MNQVFTSSIHMSAGLYRYKVIDLCEKATQWQVTGGAGVYVE